ncbi:glycosyltransferase family 4 protein [Candidatus Saccharibacteria bacterium]|nr:glycosyltransferase family 4 protein [Candidatus Saccharibacteria bacterium]
MTQSSRIRLALVVPHIFLHKDILSDVIFSPGQLALELASGLNDYGVDVTLFTPGPIDASVRNVTSDMSYFEAELALRGDSYIDLLKKHPFTFVTLARQVQSELISSAYTAANNDEYDIVHIYTNEEDTALPFAKLCNKPVVFTHHDPFNFLVKYKNIFPKYSHLNWVSMSMAQRNTMPVNTNWVANIYHGLNHDDFRPQKSPKLDYIAYLGRIIEPKGVDLATRAVKQYNQTADVKLDLLIAGKHYSDQGSDKYWSTKIEPELDEHIKYVGFIKGKSKKANFLGNAKALIIPSTFDEPFGMVMIEALACGTPIIGLDSGAIPEVINGKNGILVSKSDSIDGTVAGLSTALKQIEDVDRDQCRSDFENRFTLERMCSEHAETYRKLTKSQAAL